MAQGRPHYLARVPEVISHQEMCRREGANLRRGMHFRLRGGHSLLLMSVRPDAPYHDRLEAGALLYQGHDAPRRGGFDPKAVDQPALTPQGRPTQNGLFFGAAQATARREQPPERVQVYQKLGAGRWADLGLFELKDAWQEPEGRRRVFIFKLVPVA